MALKKRTKIAFASGDFAGTFSTTIIGIFYLYYLTNVLLISPAIAGLIILVGNLWDAISDPWIGAISDRTRHPMGRRRPFLLYGAIPFMISFALLWMIPMQFDNTGRIIAAFITYVIYITAITVVMVPYTALVNDITDDYDERSSLQGYRMIVSLGGGLIAMILPEMIVDATNDLWLGHLIMGSVFAFFMGIAPLIPFFWTREKKAVHPAPTSLVNNMKNAFSIKPFRYMVAIYLMVWATIGVIQSVLKYYIDYWLLRPELFVDIAGVMSIVAVFTIPFWVWMTTKFDKKVGYYLGIGLFAVVIIGLSLLPRDTSYEGLLVYSFILGIGLSATHVIPVSMIPDAIEYGSKKLGSNQEGAFYGVISFVQKIGVALAIGMAGVFLEVSGFISGNDVLNSSTESVLWAIRLLIGFLPGIIMFLSLAIIRFYPITRKNYHQMLGEGENVK